MICLRKCKRELLNMKRIKEKRVSILFQDTKCDKIPIQMQVDFIKPYFQFTIISFFDLFTTKITCQADKEFLL